MNFCAGALVNWIVTAFLQLASILNLNGLYLIEIFGSVNFPVMATFRYYL
jgi:hypothetical protein